MDFVNRVVDINVTNYHFTNQTWKFVQTLIERKNKSLFQRFRAFGTGAKSSRRTCSRYYSFQLSPKHKQPSQ